MGGGAGTHLSAARVHLQPGRMLPVGHQEGVHGTGADDGGCEVSDQAAEGGAGGGNGVLRGLLGGTCGRGLRAVDALQAVGVVGVEGEGDDAAVHLQRAHLQFQPVADLADGRKVRVRRYPDAAFHIVFQQPKISEFRDCLGGDGS